MINLVCAKKNDLNASCVFIKYLNLSFFVSLEIPKKSKKKERIEWLHLCMNDKLKKIVIFFYNKYAFFCNQKYTSTF